MDTTFWNETTGEPRVWKLTSAVRRRAGGKGLSYRYLACCLSYYDLDEPLPDHSSLTRIRQRFGLSVFRRFFEAIVEQCRQAKLIWGKDLYFDATKVEANASMESVTPRFAVEAHLAQLFAGENEEECSQVREETSSEEQAPPLLPTSLSETQREHIAATNAHRHDWIEEGGRPNREETHGSYRRVADYRVSTTDPDATIMPTKGQGFHLGYHTHYVSRFGHFQVGLRDSAASRS